MPSYLLERTLVSDLLLDHNLRKSKPEDEVSQVARERTLTTLRRLDANCNKTVLQFLQDAHLIGVKDAVIHLYQADLSGADLSGAILSEATLSWANLSDATLSGADLREADLRGAILCKADLRGANFSKANLTRAQVTEAQLNTAASLQGATLPDGSKHP